MYFCFSPAERAVDEITDACDSRHNRMVIVWRGWERFVS